MRRILDRTSLAPLLTALPVLALAVAPLGSSCVALAGGAAAGFLISQEVLPNAVHSATVARDVDEVWVSVQDTLGLLSFDPITVEDFPRVATGVVEGATVIVKVHAYDLDRTVISVEAEKYLVSRGEIAERVMNSILDRIQ